MSPEQNAVPEDLLKDFFAEAGQQLAVLEKNALALEAEPDRRDFLDEIFRAAHNLKGASATVKIAEIESLTHLLEDVFDAVRLGFLTVSRELADALLEAVDALRIMVEARAGGGTWAGGCGALEERLRAFLPAPAKHRPADVPAAAARQRQHGDAAPSAAGPCCRVAVSFSSDNPMPSVGGIQVYAILNRAGQVVETEPDMEALSGDTFYERVVYTVATALSESELSALCTLPGITLGCEISRQESLPASGTRKPEPGTEEDKTGLGTESSDSRTYQPPLRVESRRIDDLLELANAAMTVKAALNRLCAQFEDTLEAFRGTEASYRHALRQLNRSLPKYLEDIRKKGSTSELREQIRTQFDRMVDGFHGFQQALGEKNSRFRHTAMSLGRITEELQESILRVRMVPLSSLFSRFPRLVRDLTRSVEKKVELVLSGEDTELDRSIVEDIQDPLVHCVRNAVDHGIESPADRSRSGKAPVGKIALSAWTEKGGVVITVEDDGQGIDVQRVRDRARERGLIAADASPSTEELFELIFTPGFSTADTVTRISGRGVGLDVIRRQVEQLNGTVRLWSEAGRGTRFTLRLPLRLAVVTAILARSGETIFAVPAPAVAECLPLRKTELDENMSGPGLFFRGERIPLLRPVSPFKVDAEECRVYKYVIILREGGELAGLLVDSMLGEEDILVRPPSGPESPGAGSAGYALLADGSPAAVLDTRFLLSRARSQV